MAVMVTDMVKEWLDSRGYTGLVNKDMPCGCGLDDLAPCGEMTEWCEAAYAVLCDGTVCSSCESRPHPMRDDFEAVCFAAVGTFDGEDGADDE